MSQLAISITPSSQPVLQEICKLAMAVGWHFTHATYSGESLMVTLETEPNEQPKFKPSKTRSNWNWVGITDRINQDGQ